MVFITAGRSGAGVSTDVVADDDDDDDDDEESITEPAG